MRTRPAGFSLDQSEANWPDRLAIGSGIESLNGHYFPLSPWRPPTPDELTRLLVANPTAPPGVLSMLGEDTVSPAHVPAPDDHICLFQTPEHLRNAWWDLFGASVESGKPMEGFEAFAAKVADFLAFKGLGDSGSIQMEVLVTAAGARSIRIDSVSGQPSGLGSTVAPWAAWPLKEASTPQLHAVVNLGDEATGVVLINLTLPGLAAELAESSAPTVGELVALFLKTHPDYPPVRLQLGPGEGCRLPAEGLILDGDATGKEEPSVLLLISRDKPASGSG